MVSPRQTFEDNIRPAELLLRVYRLLECDTIHTNNELVTKLRAAVGADADVRVLAPSKETTSPVVPYPDPLCLKETHVVLPPFSILLARRWLIKGFIQIG